MKRELLTLVSLLIPFMVYSGAVKVNLETAGTLQQVLSDQEETKVTELTITGEINSVDIIYLRSGVGRVASLEVLDLKDVTLVASEEPYLTIKTSGSFSSGVGSETYYISDEERCDSVQSASSGWIIDDAVYYQVSFYGKNLAGAFQDMSLKKVVLPSSVRKIEYKTFGNCKSLESVEMPSGISEIGWYAFSGCESLTSIEITPSVTLIGDCAFSGCSKMERIGDISGVRQIGIYAFSDCSSLLGEGNGQLDLSNIIVIPDGAFCSCNSLTSIKFSDNLKSIGESAFYDCYGLSSVVLPEGLLSIGDRAFYGCTSLSSVTLPSTLEFLTYESFANTAWLDNQTDTDGIVYFGNVAVAYNTYVKDHGTVYPTSLTFREGTVGIGDGFKYINGDNSGKANLTSISFPSTLRRIGKNAFENSKIPKIDLPEGLETIGAYAFWNCSELDDFITPSSLKSFGRCAFMGCKSLSKINIPENVEELNEAFDGCNGIVQVDLHAKHLENEKEKGQLGSLYGLEKLVVGSQVEILPYYVFSGSDEAKIVFEERNSDSKLFFGGLSCKELILPDCEIELGPGALSGTNFPIEILGTVISIGDGALYGCTGLKSIRLSDKMIEIPEKAFYECSNLVSVKLPLNISSIGNSVFENCSSLASIDIPESVTTIGEYAFFDCKSLGEIVFPSGITSIGKNAFSRCESLSTVTIPNSITGELDYVFSGCTGLKNINFPEGIKKIWSGMFSGCTGLVSLIIPSTVEIIEDGAFGSCSALENIDLPGVEFIEDNAFYGCESLKSVSFSPNLISIGEWAFRDCYDLEKLTIPSLVEDIGSYAFTNCYALTEVHSLIREPFEIAKSVFYNQEDVMARKWVYTNAILYVPYGTKEKYEATPYWNEFKEIIEIPDDGLTPIEDDVNFSENGSIDEKTNLNGTVIDNIYYNISSDNGGFDANDDCIVITKDTSDEQMKAIEGLDITDEELKQNFTGIIFKVPAGSGKVTVTAETTGNMTLKVKVGSGETLEMELSGKLKMKVPYVVSEESLVYIFAGTTDENAARGVHKAPEEKSLKIYGIEWTSSNEGKLKKGDVNGDSKVNGTDIQAVINVIVDEDYVEEADVNQDNKVNGTDIQEIINIIVEEE
jgi:hypothetical protein